MTIDLDDIERLTQKVSYLVPNQRLNPNEELFVRVVCRRETILELVRLARLGTLADEVRRAPDDKLPAEIAEQCRLNAMGQEREAKLMAEVERLKTENQYLRTIAKLGLSFAPRAPVEPGLAPMFYHTLSYEAEVKLQRCLNDARRYLADD